MYTIACKRLDILINFEQMLREFHQSVEVKLIVNFSCD